MNMIGPMFMRTQLSAIFLLPFIVSSCATKSIETSSELPKRAADFSLPTLDGKQVSLGQLGGKVVVLDFWATWCPPCREGLPHLQRLATNSEMAQRGLVVVAMNEEESQKTIRTFVDQNHYSFTVALDSDGLARRAYDVSEFPTTVIIARDGLVKSVISGWTQDTARQIDEAVGSALGAPIR